ncbi:hypothetical protein MAM1_0001d00065 [Mucor ambiguus]|uniref:Uncharacterized protein n=1 Tax=Mucor ambiguus TaxID=91626 RepID=A0A0C9MF87_9FUNG|nr:hypothetical protein MAM1_0001d00065 [Mucor ambiguus]
MLESTKRRPVPYLPSVPQALKPSDTNTPPPLGSLLPHTPTLPPASEDPEMDTSPDLVSALSSPNGHRSPSPTPLPRKLRKSSRLRGTRS